MYKKTLIALSILIHTIALSQNSFCDGWKDGYKRGKRLINDDIYIIPICPIVISNTDPYEHGYSLGLKKATGRDITTIPTVNGNDDNFCDGWEDGYKSGLQTWADDNNRFTPSRITPICPIARVNHDTYLHGYNKGKQRAINDMQ